VRTNQKQAKAMKTVWKSVSIEDLIKALQKAQDTGAKTAQVNGTVMVPDNGNLILISTEKQS
jgi:formate dehydrogenase assembly factor FdhD